MASRAPQPDPFVRPNWRSGLIFLVLGTVSIAVAFGLLATIRGNADGAALCFGGGAATIASSIAVFLRQDYDTMEPLTTLILMVIIGIGLTAPYVTFNDSDHVRDFMLLGQGTGFLLRPMFYIILGLLAVNVGYMLPARRPLGKSSSIGNLLNRSWQPSRVPVVVILVTVVSIISIYAFSLLLSIDLGSIEDISRKRFYEIEGATTEGSLGYLRWGGRLVQTGLFVFLLYRIRTGKSFWSVGTISVSAPLLLLTVAIPFLTNSRAPMVMDLIGVLAIIYYTGAKVSGRSVLLAVFLAIAVFQIMTAFRQRQDVGNYATMEQVGLSILGSRHFIDITRTGVVLEAVPEKMSYRYGSTFFAWVAAPIPRSVWKTKPPFGIGKDVARQAFGHNDRRGVPPGLFGEATINFGVFGIIPVFLLAGMGMRWVYERFRKYLQTDSGILLYAATSQIAVFYLFNNEFSVFLVRTLIAAIPIAISIWFLNGASQRRLQKSGQRRPRRTMQRWAPQPHA